MGKSNYQLKMNGSKKIVEQEVRRSCSALFFGLPQTMSVPAPEPGWPPLAPYDTSLFVLAACVSALQLPLALALALRAAGACGAARPRARAPSYHGAQLAALVRPGEAPPYYAPTDAVARGQSPLLAVSKWVFFVFVFVFF